MSNRRLRNLAANNIDAGDFLHGLEVISSFSGSGKVFFTLENGDQVSFPAEEKIAVELAD